MPFRFDKDVNITPLSPISFALITSRRDFREAKDAQPQRYAVMRYRCLHAITLMRTQQRRAYAATPQQWCAERCGDFLRHLRDFSGRSSAEVRDSADMRLH